MLFELLLSKHENNSKIMHILRILCSYYAVYLNDEKMDSPS